MVAKAASQGEEDLIGDEGPERGGADAGQQGQEAAMDHQAAEQHHGLSFQARTDQNRPEPVFGKEMFGIHEWRLRFLTTKERDNREPTSRRSFAI